MRGSEFLRSWCLTAGLWFRGKQWQPRKPDGRGSERAINSCHDEASCHIAFATPYPTLSAKPAVTVRLYQQYHNFAPRGLSAVVWSDQYGNILQYLSYYLLQQPDTIWMGITQQCLFGFLCVGFAGLTCKSLLLIAVWRGLSWVCCRDA